MNPFFYVEDDEPVVVSEKSIEIPSEITNKEDETNVLAPQPAPISSVI